MEGKGIAFFGKSGCRVRCSWGDLAGNFPQEKDCLAAFILLESAEVLAGLKPANLVRVPGRVQPCGRNLLELWDEIGPGILSSYGLHAELMREMNGDRLFLLLRPDLLGKRLSGRSAAAFLRRVGYPAPHEWREALKYLKLRFDEESIPHEIGVFLGYPLKDVAAFIGWKNLPVACQRLWKIYGRPRRSLLLADAYRAARLRMAGYLSGVGEKIFAVQEKAVDSSFF